MNEDLADIAVIGMAVMGQNLILNINDHGYKVIAYNRTLSKVDDFLSGPAKNTSIIGVKSAAELAAKLKKPRRVMLMVKAGDAVDQMIDSLLTVLEAGDIVIDGGNSHYVDTIRREMALKNRGIHFVGCGISGGEDGARHGPSIMPGGSSEAWPQIKEIFQAIAAKGFDNKPCCNWLGPSGAGHYTKMVHNGIEYGDMQLISEVYLILKDLLNVSYDEMSDIFSNWNKSNLESYLIEITANILKYKDDDSQPLLEKIVDSAGQKGTGKWTVISASELGQPLSVIAEALFARFISSLKDTRNRTSEVFNENIETNNINKDVVINDLKGSLYISKIISYAQGFMLLSSASKEFNWNIDMSIVAQLWSGGCIIRSKFLSDVSETYKQNVSLENLMLAPFFIEQIKANIKQLRNIIKLSAEYGLPAPALSSALSFYDSIRKNRLPANLIQAQRDYFGAHSYQRIDKQTGEFFHTNWTGEGGNISSGNYNF